MLNLLKNATNTTVKTMLSAPETMEFLKDIKEEAPALYLNGHGVPVAQMYCDIMLKPHEKINVTISVSGGEYTNVEISRVGSLQKLQFLPF